MLFACVIFTLFWLISLRQSLFHDSTCIDIQTRRTCSRLSYSSTLELTKGFHKKNWRSDRFLVVENFHSLFLCSVLCTVSVSSVYLRFTVSVRGNVANSNADITILFSWILFRKPHQLARHTHENTSLCRGDNDDDENDEKRGIQQNKTKWNSDNVSYLKIRQARYFRRYHEIIKIFSVFCFFLFLLVSFRCVIRSLTIVCATVWLNDTSDAKFNMTENPQKIVRVFRVSLFVEH